MKIRAANNQDAKAISHLIFNIWVHEYHFDVKTEDYPDLKQIEQYYTAPGGLFLIAVDENNESIIGTIACEQLNEHVYVLKRMFVVV